MRILKNFCIACIKFYSWILSPVFYSFGVRCRFSLSCSRYALAAVEKHGVLWGILLTIGRLLRCHPFCEGGHDPVPEIVAGKNVFCRATLESGNG